MTTNHIEAFRQAMREHGLDYEGPLHDDSKLHRIACADDSEENSWYKLHPPNPMAAGAFGCWKRQISEKWCHKNGAPLDPATSARLREQWKKDALEREEMERRVHEQVSERITAMVEDLDLAFADHEYATRKMIKPMGALLLDGDLLIQLRDVQGRLWSYQTIAPDGTKRFCPSGRIKGCHWKIGTSTAGPLLICEGWATAVTLHMATGHQVVAAMNCGNLMEVAQAYRRRSPHREIVLCADNDRKTEGNPGVTKAREAAKAVRGRLIIAQLPESVEGSDFNDIHCHPDGGLSEVNLQIEAGLKQPALEPEAAVQKAADAVISTASDVDEYLPSDAEAESALAGGSAHELDVILDPEPDPLPEPISIEDAMLFKQDDDSNTLIGRRYLCRGGSCLFVGGSGIGKSVITLQAAIVFALGRDLFGLKPKRPLKSVIIAAEDDFGDISETIQGVFRSLKILPGTPEFQMVTANVLIFQQNVLKNEAFLSWLERLVSEHKPDLQWINPLLSFYTHNPSDPEKSGEFTSGLQSIQERHGVCSMVVHHTGKPKEAKTTEGWSMDDFSYIGLGSSVWTNWARAIIVLQGMKRPANTFSLRFAKRGQRAGIVNDDLEYTRQIYIRHGEDGDMCWHLSDYTPADQSDSVESSGRPSKISWERVASEWDGTPFETSQLKNLIMDTLRVSDKSAWRAIQKWSGIHVVKNTRDLWVKASE